ncbi:CheR family methyltransferase [Verrucomicrobium spinosum]|uniref:CheR family methyltransferase n=1 Tax=Verrucomicrobium spinosum TaxID=2736 RepID=UPI0009E90EBE|nr:protein-glutamate O-methyltransferase CheR [Verrucomicrobium spinosum]
MPHSHNHITNLLKESIGVDAATMGKSVVTNAVRQRMAACGLQETGAYWNLLRRSDEELAQLVELVVVPETWFFRDPAAYAALVHHVRQEWGPAHPTGRLRVLSAPCSTGEEPYTIAMALLDAGLPAMRFQIDAIDISERALARARRAVYGRNAFRGSDVGFRERYFREEQGLHRLTPLVRECVDFRQANLVSDDPLPGAGSYDAIFCRNVLIYFDAPTQERVIRALDRLLAPEGLLFVGPAETFLTRSAGFTSVDFPSAFACRRAARKSGVQLSGAAASVSPAFRPFTMPPPGRGEPRNPVPARRQSLPPGSWLLHPLPSRLPCAVRAGHRSRGHHPAGGWRPSGGGPHRM